MGFEVERHDELRAAVVHITGDVDVAVVPELREMLGSLVDVGFVNIVLDIANVIYVDSSALSMLVWLDRRLQSVLGKVVLTGANRDVRRVLEVSRLASVAPTMSEEGDVGSVLGTLDNTGDGGSPEWTENLSVPADVGRLAEVRELVCALLAPVSFSDAALFDIKVALGEALANAVRHGSPEGESDVLVRVAAYPDKAVIEVEDTGGGFDGDHICSDDLYASGGRGIMFMRALMDQVAFSCGSTGGTVVRLVKRRVPVGDGR